MSFCFSIVIPLLLFATVTDVEAGALGKLLAFHNSDEASMWDAWPIDDYMSAINDWEDDDYLDMPWDKIKRTSELHPKTKYGCAYQTKNAFFGIYIVAVCIYQRKGAETRCFCN
ncbi:unnamed protein product [Nippostrongylus brasiliensis]|uniref:SCP domain-containing protein n=1 Tax=Nippostrongylus brasiliensis TaxID=27835 RepID=A0A0N4XVU8_NIPBR|nr:unnamed protein product [Nippostrongylus brasiliensis]